MQMSTYEKLKRVAAVFGSVYVWYLSVNFSRDGFNFSVMNDSTVGVGLALFITLLELIFNGNGGDGNKTLFFAGIMAYIYGVYTNVAGVMQMGGMTLAVSAFTEQPLLAGFRTVLGFLLEVAPEPILIYGLTGIVGGGDALSVISGASNQISRQAKNVWNNRNNTGGGGKQKNQNQNQNRPVFVEEEQSFQDFPSRRDYRGPQQGLPADFTPMKGKGGNQPGNYANQRRQ